MNTLLDLLYPQSCLFCDILCDSPLCPSCFDLLEKPDGRCRLCASDDLIQKKLCRECLAHPPPVSQTCSALTYQGPAIALLHAFRKNGPHLAKSLASLMLLAIEHLPTPDFLIPWPSSLFSGRPSHLLTQHLSDLLQRPIASRRTPLTDRHLLLVGDLLTSSAELSHSASTLQGRHPSRLDVIVLCRRPTSSPLELTPTT
jgi:predicted amidophosphoribosyltransferase